jgi:hypothetical protein
MGSIKIPNGFKINPNVNKNHSNNIETNKDVK